MEKLKRDCIRDLLYAFLIKLSYFIQFLTSLNHTGFYKKSYLHTYSKWCIIYRTVKPLAHHRDHSYFSTRVKLKYWRLETKMSFYIDDMLGNYFLNIDTKCKIIGWYFFPSPDWYRICCRPDLAFELLFWERLLYK